MFELWCDKHNHTMAFIRTIGSLNWICYSVEGVVMKVIALDIETKNLDMESEGLDFGNPEGWKTSCVSIWDSSGKGGFLQLRRY